MPFELGIQVWKIVSIRWRPSSWMQFSIFRLKPRFGDVPWPPRPPDLSCDFFLWGYLKGRVYIHKPRNLNELKDAIRQEELTIDQQLLARAVDDFKRRIENCIQQDVRHLNDTIFHTWIPNSNDMSWPLTLRLLMSYIYGAPILDVSRSHTTTHHSR